MLVDRLRNRIACYAAAVTIILQQLNSQANPAPLETPTPLVRIRASFGERGDWHPDELISNRSGTKSVLVWESGRENPTDTPAARILSN